VVAVSLVLVTTGLVVVGVVVFVVVAASLLQLTAKEINPTNSTTASRATNALLMFRIVIYSPLQYCLQ
jgi:hypothetical protein